MWEKSFLWNHGGTTDAGGMKQMAQHSGDDTNRNIESFWELKGGAFRLSAVKSNLDEVSYNFRINVNDQLELYKITKANDSQTQTFKQIAKFGMIA